MRTDLYSTNLRSDDGFKWPFNLQAIGNDIVITYVLYEEGSGTKQTFLTLETVLGTFQIAERLRSGIGGGVQPIRSPLDLDCMVALRLMKPACGEEGQALSGSER
jgi:hypothetical protein